MGDGLISMLVVCTTLPRECNNMKPDVSYEEVSCNKFLYKMEDVYGPL